MNKIKFTQEAQDKIMAGLMSTLSEKKLRLDSERVEQVIKQSIPTIRIDYNQLADKVKDYFHQPYDGKDGRPGERGLPGKPGVNGRDGINGKDGVRGPQGTEGKPGKGLTREDKARIIQSVQDRINLDPYLLKQDFNDQISTLIKHIESGKIKSKKGGGGAGPIQIVQMVNEYLGTESWQGSSSIQVLKDGDQATTTSWVGLTGWGTPGILDDQYTFSDGEVTIVDAGTYNLNLIVQSVVSAAEFHQLNIKMQQDTGTGYADIAGCFDYSPAINQTGFYSADYTPSTTKTVTAQITNFFIGASSGTKIKPLIQHIETAGLVSTGNARISIQRIK